MLFNLPLLEDLRPRSVQDFFKTTHEDSQFKDLPGANDTLVIMRTGSTELPDKLPIHLTTTLRRYPNFMIFSDFGEEYEGHVIIDALQSVSPRMKELSPDFDLWRRLQQYGRTMLRPDELSGKAIWVDQGTGKAANPGWCETPLYVGSADAYFAVPN